MRIFLTSLLLVTCSSCLWAWTELTGNIRGIVTNQESGQAIRGATIQLVPFDNPDQKAIAKSFSKEVGEYIFANVRPGIYNIECQAFGYKTTRLIGVQIREDRTKLAYFKLTRGISADVDEVFTYASLEAQQKATTATSTATAQSLEDAPATIYVFSAEDIQDHGYMSLDELLADVPEFEVQRRHSDREFNSFSARGVYGNKRLLILVDGHRYNSMMNSQYTIAENYNIRYASRVEVILGPASALYGPDAYMGVVNIITRKGKEAKGLAATGSYGIYNTTNNALHWGLGTDKLSFSVTGSGFYSDGPPLNELYTDAFSWHNTNYQNNGQVRQSPATPTTLTTVPVLPFGMRRWATYLGASFQYKKFSASLHTNNVTHSSATGASPDYAPYQNGLERSTNLINLNLEQIYQPKQTDKWYSKTELNSSLYFLNAHSKTYDSFTDYQDGYQAASDLGTRLTQTLVWRFDKANQLTVGLLGQYSAALATTNYFAQRPNQWLFSPLDPIDTRAQNIYYLGTDVRDSDGNDLKIYQNFYYLHRIIGGAFAEYQLNIKDKLLMTIGGRYDQVIDIVPNAIEDRVLSYLNISPRLGLIYKPTDHWNIKLFFGEGFLQPTPELKYNHTGSFDPEYDDNGAITGIQGGVWTLPNENLGPEVVQSYELSTRYSKGDFTIGLNGYYNFIEWMTTFETIAEDPTYQDVELEAAQRAVNSEEDAFVYGATVRADYRLVFGKEEQLSIKLNASYTYTDGFIEGYAFLPYTARHTGRLGILAKLHKRFTWSNRLSFRSGMYNGGIINDATGRVAQDFTAPFLLWNSFMRYQFLEKDRLQLSVFAQVSNVLNQRYFNLTDKSAIALGQSPQDPIRFVLGLSANFGKR